MGHRVAIYPFYPLAHNHLLREHYFTGLHRVLPQPGSGIPSAMRVGAHNVARNSTAANKAIVFFTVQSPFRTGFDRDNVLFAGLVPDHRGNGGFSKSVIPMTLNSALEDLRGTTLKAISGSLRRLEYFARLRNSQGGYTHWGLARVHGQEAAAKALEHEHRTVVSKILSTPIRRLVADVEECSRIAGLTPAQYLDKLSQELNLLPPAAGAGSARHLNSVLRTLSSLVKTPSAATHPIS
jgi:hypothetical protein